MRGIIEEAIFNRRGHYGRGVCVGRVCCRWEIVQEFRLLATCLGKGGSPRGPGCLLDAIQCHSHHVRRNVRCLQQKLV